MFLNVFPEKMGWYLDREDRTVKSDSFNRFKPCFETLWMDDVTNYLETTIPYEFMILFCHDVIA